MKIEMSYDAETGYWTVKYGDLEGRFLHESAVIQQVRQWMTKEELVQHDKVSR